MTTIQIRPITRANLSAVPGKCWEGPASQERLIQAQEILGMAAWDGDKCVGQLHCYRVMPPQWDNENFPSYGRRDPKAWPLGWPLQVAMKHDPVLRGPIWGHGCFHVGVTLATGEADAAYSHRGIGSALCGASIQWAREHGYAILLALAGTALIPDFNIWMGCLPWKVYERLGAISIATEEDGTKLPWWSTQCPPAAQEQLQQSLRSGATPRELCARVMAMTLGA